MNLGLVALKLRAQNTRFGNRVVGAAELAIAQQYTLQNETAFVIPLSEAVNGPNANDTFVNQRVRETFGIVCAIKNDQATTDKLGFTAYDLHGSVRAELLHALLGWTMPTPADGHPEVAALVYYNGGRIIDITPAWLWYSYEFVTETRITSDVDGVDAALAATFTDQFLKVYTQYVIGGDSVLPLTGAAPQLPTTLIAAPTLTELFGPEFSFGDGFDKGMDTLDTAAS